MTTQAERDADAAKHADCIERTGFPATFLPPSLYAMMLENKDDMRDYVINRPMPQMFVSSRSVRKHLSEKMCSGKESVCLAGLNGKCVACSDED